MDLRVGTKISLLMGNNIPHKRIPIKILKGDDVRVWELVEMYLPDIRKHGVVLHLRDDGKNYVAHSDLSGDDTACPWRKLERAS